MKQAPLFGTDGIRGIFGRFPLTPALTLRLGKCAGQVLRNKFPQQKIRVIGACDTRASGPMLFQSLSAGLRQQGVDVYDAGVVSTPSIAHLVVAHRFQSGFVISASHNPPEFNGIKFFNFVGRKWPDEWEREVESLFYGSYSDKANGLSQGALLDSHDFSTDYIDFLVRTLPRQQRFASWKIAMDCSHGANSKTAPALFRALGADVLSIGDTPSGTNINVDCGSQHLSQLQKLVVSKKCDIGIAFDGDADRVIFVDEKGHVVDGDHTLAILSWWMKKNKALRKNLVVVTVMANLGLKHFLRNQGMRMIETPVGDRHVSEAMRIHGAALGGEQSGHVILGDYLPSGDGLLTALHMMSVLENSQEKLSALSGRMRKFPQVLLNVRVQNKVPLNQIPSVSKEIQRTEKKLGTSGRVLVRYSGTEPLLRIMLEGPDKNVIQEDAQRIATLVEESLN